MRIRRMGSFGKAATLAHVCATLLAAVMFPAGAHAGGTAPCKGLVIEAETGSGQDIGWQGTVHDSELAVGGSTAWSFSKCSAGDEAACFTNADCAAGTCVSSCNCSGDTSCDLIGPVDTRRCLANLAECTTNADCPSSGACVSYFGPPQPISISGSPFCTLTHFEDTPLGSYESSSGDVSISATLRRRYFLGEAADRPCPRCGAPDQNPKPGDQFTCSGGSRNGQSCIVEGVTPFFGGTSSDCPPNSFAAVGGSGSVIRLGELSSDPAVRTAKLQCTQTGFTGNPTVPASNPKCTDDLAGPVCSSNADCRRCTGDFTETCTTNTDCTGIGTCAEAPDQPVSCGFWCHCGFCNNDATKPCFETSDCPNGETCQKGTGTTSQQNAPQQRPNDCSNDGYLCGTDTPERCDSSSVGSCSLAPFRSCSVNADCQGVSAGTCTFADEPCFESRIARSGTSVPLGRQCAFEQKSCNTNADCTGGGDFCVNDASRADMVGVYCQSATTSSTLNTPIGLAGPGAITLDAFVKVCRCEGSEPGCASVCGASGAACGNGTVEDDEDCDGGPCCAGDCTFLGTASVCRASAGSCDVAETCSGTSAGCPANTFAPTSTACRASAGVCDVAESCSGTSATCPADTFASTSTACRGSAGVCDVAESCSGTSATCPADTFATTATTCRASAGDCDAAETCSGTLATCPANGSEPDGTTCDDGNACTIDDECLGGSCSGSPDPECEAVCGDGSLDDGEACDDGNATFTVGEYCGVSCVLIPCGRPTNGSGDLPKTSDALFILRTAVGQVSCSPRVCSVDGNQTILTSDALRVLRAAVGQTVSLDCPTE